MHLRRSVLISCFALIPCLTACTPAQRAAFTSWYSAGVNAAPSPVSGLRCPPGPVKDEIDRVFGFAAPWAESIAWRESNCEPGARNASGSAGVFQLLGHDDLLHDACPDEPPERSWAEATCNVRAAKLLYDGSGIGPWHL